MQYKKTHPILIVEGIYKFIPLLLFPLVRGFVSALEGGVYAWLGSAWVDIAVVLVIVLLAVLRWRTTYYLFDGETVCIKGGLFSYKDKKVPIKEVCSVCCESPWFYRPLRATRLRFDTLCGTKRRADISITLSTDEADNIVKSINNSLNINSKGMKKTYSPKLLYIMVISAFLSDSFAGAGFAATFFTKAGSLVGRELETQVFGTLNNIIKNLSFKIPPVATAIAIIVLGGWVIGFVLNLIRHQNLSLAREKNTLTVRAGRLTRRTTLIRVDNVNFINIRQGLFTKLIGIYTVFGHCAGIGKKKEDITTLIPAGNKKEIDNNFNLLLAEFPRAKITLRPNKSAVFRFIGAPLWPCIILPTTTVLLMEVFLRWRELVLFVGFMSSIPAYWWLVVRIVDFKTSGIGVNEASVTLKYSTFLKLNTAIIPREKIVLVKLRQSPLQKIDSRCDVFVYTKGESRYRHRVRNLDVKNARKLLRI